MNSNYKIGIVLTVMAAIIITASAYLYWEFGMPESVYRREGANPFWTSLENDTTSIVIKQGETKTVPVELNYWKGLRTGLGIKFEVPEELGLYNPPDGLEISLDIDDGYVQVDNGKIINIFTHRDVQLKEPSDIDQRLGQDGQMVVAEVGAVTVSVSKEVPLGTYAFSLGTSDAQLDSRYGSTSQLLEIVVVENDDETAVPLTRMNLTSVQAYTFSQELIGDIVPNMEFKKGEEVLLNATFVNPSNTESVHDFILTLGIRDENEDPLPDDISIITGNSIMPGGTITVENSWVPDKIGKYDVMIFSISESNLHSTIPNNPAAIIPITVVD